MSEEKVTLELVGARLMGLTAEVRDVQQRVTVLEARFTAMEARFTAFSLAMEARLDALEKRFGAQEDRINRLLSLVVRIAERLDGGPAPV